MHWFVNMFSLKSRIHLSVVSGSDTAVLQLPYVFLCIPLSILATCLSLQVFFNSFLYSSLAYKILADTVKGVYLLHFFFLKKEKKIQCENKVD